MTAAQFTPGPWNALAKADRVYVSGLGNVARVENPWNNEAEREANCRLIAAAPDLYEAVRLFVEYDTAADSDGVAMMLTYAAALAAAKLALAKIEAQA